MNTQLSSMERVLTTMSMKEPDRVPLFLMATHRCAKFFDLSIKNYFSNPENVAKGQLVLMREYNNDCLNPFYSAAHEVAAFGMEVIYSEDGPPNAGEPIIKNYEDILKLELPDVKQSKPLKDSLRAIDLLKSQVGNTIPISGAVISPFTLPILQMGFGKYIELLYERPDLLKQLLKINTEFCTQWANLQLSAGATFISIIDSMAVSSVTPKPMYMQLGYPSFQKSVSEIRSAVAIATSSASTASITEEILSAGIKAILVSHEDDLTEIKKQVNGRATLLGNLNGIQMCNWSRSDAEISVKTAINSAAEGGGFVLCDSLGDLPYQVSEATLRTIAEAVNEYGTYSLKRR